MSVAVAPSKNFIKQLGKLPPNRQRAATEALKKFIVNQTSNGLHFRQLKSNTGYFLIDSAHGDRIVLKDETQGRYIASDVGPHDNILRRWNR